MPYLLAKIRSVCMASRIDKVSTAVGSAAETCGGIHCILLVIHVCPTLLLFCIYFDWGGGQSMGEE